MRKESLTTVDDVCRAATRAYEEGHYAEAVQHTESAVAMGEHWLLLTLADIYRRSLDGKTREPGEAAILYLLASDYGDGDAMAYLHSLSPSLVEEERDLGQRVSSLVSLWEGAGAIK